jgi:uncharacterized protein YbjQ (UPF0145 family)
MGKIYGTVSATCPTCGNAIGSEHPYTWCIECGKQLPLDTRSAIPSLRAALEAKQSARAAEEESKRKLARTAGIILTTADRLDGYRVTETLDVITAECAFGFNLFGDFFTAVSDLFGVRSATTQAALREARKKCLAELRAEAALLDADAVIGVDLDYNEFSGGGKAMLFLVASGTAVKIVRG